MAAGEPAARVETCGRQDADPDPPRDARRGRVLTRPLVYIDASALAKLFLDEPESAELKRFLAAQSALTSAHIVRVELMRSLRRAEAPAAVIEQARSSFERIHVRRLSDEILARAGEISPRSLRTLDAIHLATALDLSPPPDLFLCYDRRLADAARANGLAVVSPGVEEVHEP